MKTIKTLLVDDEPSSRNVLKQLLRNFCPEIELCGEAASADEAFELVNLHHPRLVFLDVQMPNGNGFSLLRKFETIEFDVVFVTGFDKFAIEAIKFHALDYLLKPVEVADLKLAVQKSFNRLHEKQSASSLVVNLLANLDQATTEKKIPLHASNQVRFVSLGDIIYFEANGNYTEIETESTERFLSSKHLKEFEGMLEGFDQFIRVNRSAIVNTAKISAYNKTEPFLITLSNQKQLEISRRKRNEVLERIKGK